MSYGQEFDILSMKRFDNVQQYGMITHLRYTVKPVYNDHLMG